MLKSLHTRKEHYALIPKGEEKDYNKGRYNYLINFNHLGVKSICNLSFGKLLTHYKRILIIIFKGNACSSYHTLQRIIRHMYRQFNFCSDPFIKPS